jgi:BlaI family transcriptional regulator, penicillinase repressor
MAKARVSAGRHETPSGLTGVEWAIMKVVWQNEPCAAGTVQEALASSHDWAYSTVKTTMDRMVAKGLLATTAIRNLTLFSAQISRVEAQRSELRRVIGRAFDGALTPLIQFLVEDEDLTHDEIAELRELIKRRAQS